MALIVRNDEQIKVGTTPGLVAGASFFTFDGTGTPAKPDYRNNEIVVSEINGRGILVKDVDFTWNYITGLFTLLGIVVPVFVNAQYYNIHFQPIAQPPVGDRYSLINNSFFIRSLNIPNLNDAKILERLNYFIQQYEPECLEDILGYALYKVFLTENTDRMTWLTYGAEYVDGYGVTRNWKGLVHDQNISLIANYIYFMIQEASASQTTGSNTSIPKGESSILVSPADKMIAAWNFYSHEVFSMINYLWFKKVGNDRLYPEFTANQYSITRQISRTINSFGI